MNSTGIVRRMDDLGRLIVPKEIRNAIGVKEGELFEISVDIENKKEYEISMFNFG